MVYNSALVCDIVGSEDVHQGGCVGAMTVIESALAPQVAERLPRFRERQALVIVRNYAAHLVVVERARDQPRARWGIKLAAHRDPTVCALEHLARTDSLVRVSPKC